MPRAVAGEYFPFALLVWGIGGRWLTSDAKQTPPHPAAGLQHRGRVRQLRALAGRLRADHHAVKRCGRRRNFERWRDDRSTIILYCMRAFWFVFCCEHSTDTHAWLWARTGSWPEGDYIHGWRERRDTMLLTNCSRVHRECGARSRGERRRLDRQGERTPRYLALYRKGPTAEARLAGFARGERVRLRVTPYRLNATQRAYGLLDIDATTRVGRHDGLDGARPEPTYLST